MRGPMTARCGVPGSLSWRSLSRRGFCRPPPPPLRPPPLPPPAYSPHPTPPTNPTIATIQTPSFAGTSSGGTLTVTDGTRTDQVALLGNYMASTFVPSSDGHNGTNVIDPPAVNQNNVLVQPQHA